ncbi:MAG: hypothetical protein ACR2N6_09195 [Miltoncostaeaceae bacterium]
MSSGSQFVVAAYAVILFALVMYMVIIAMKSARIGREVELLSRIIERSRPDDAEEAGEAESASPPVKAADK